MSSSEARRDDRALAAVWRRLPKPRILLRSLHESGNLLRAADAPADLGLREVLVEAQPHDQRVALGQRVKQTVHVGGRMYVSRILRAALDSSPIAPQPPPQ